MTTAGHRRTRRRLAAAAARMLLAVAHMLLAASHMLLGAQGSRRRAPAGTGPVADIGTAASTAYAARAGWGPLRGLPTDNANVMLA
jgi:hypothetical protein